MSLLFPLIGLIVLANLSLKGGGISSKGMECFSKFNDVKQVGGAPFAKGSCSAFWPVNTNNSKKWEVPYLNTSGNYMNGNSARAFGAIRSDGKRYHVGIDLYCNDEDICVATEDGKIVAIQGFLNITKALLLETKSGVVCLYGEIKDHSWEEFNIQKGSIVKKGQPLCRIGKNEAGTQMLHFETYIKGTTKNFSWHTGTDPSSNILNPTKYLLNIANKKQA